MSTAAPARKAQLTGGYANIPNSLIENQFFLTRAELALALIVLRRGGTGEPVTVSDANWESWTGLGARQKEYAITGLKKKGLEIAGRSKFRWDRDMWESYARQASRDLAAQRAKTEGRAAAVPAKKGAMVHPDCHSGGCSMLRDEKNSSPAPLIILPGKKLESWPRSLDAVRSAFPVVTGVFIGRLVAIVRATVGPVDDDELATAIVSAYKRRQESPGLFLSTVPEVIAARRRMSVSSATIAAERAAETGRSLRDVVAAVRSELVTMPAFAGVLDDLDSLAEMDTAEPNAIDVALNECREKITAIALEVVDAAGLAAAEAEAKKEAAKYTRMSDAQRNALRVQIRDAGVIRALGITKLSLL